MSITTNLNKSNLKTFKLSDLCEVNIGRTPSRSQPKYWNGKVHWLSIADMKQGRFINHTSEQITDLGLSASNCKMVPPGTVLLSFKLSIGKVAINEIPLVTNEAIAALPVKDKNLLLPEYLFWLLKSIDLTKGLDRAAKGLTLNKAKLLEIKVSIPSIEEQRRVVEICDKMDAVLQNRRRATEKINSLSQAIFLEMFGDPIANEKSWPTSKIKEIVEGKYGVKAGPFGSALKKEDYVSSGYKIYGQEQVIGQSLNIGDYYIDKNKFESLKACEIQSGDILVSLVGTFGKMLVVPDQFQQGIINPRLLKM